MSLNLRKVSVGSLWLSKDIQVTSSVRNASQVWLDQFREEIREAEKNDPELEGSENPVSEHVNKYIKDFDPLMKGVITEDDIHELDSEA